MKKLLPILILVLMFSSCIVLTEPANEPVKKDVTVVVKHENPLVGKWRSIYDKNLTIEFTIDNELIIRTKGDIDKITKYTLENKRLYVNGEFFPHEFPNNEYKKLYISNNFISGEPTSRFTRINY